MKASLRWSMLAATCLVVAGQGVDATTTGTDAVAEAAPASTSTTTTAQDYARAESRLPGRIAIPNLRIDPQWIDGKRFWYRRDTDRGSHAFVIVDATSGRRQPAFDHARLARSLSGLAEAPLSPQALPLRSLQFDANGFEVGLDGLRARCTLRADRCTRLDAPATPAIAGQVLSPDGRWVAFVQDHNLHLRVVATGATRALTRDGVLHNAWATVSESQLNTLSHARGLPVWGNAHDSARVLWSPSSGLPRFYERDMIHPSAEAKDYINQKFSESYFSEDTRSFIKTWTGIQNALAHRPFQLNSPTHQKFLKDTLQKLESVRNLVSVNEEIQLIQSQLHA